jgi:hypothetical protein
MAGNAVYAALRAPKLLRAPRVKRRMRAFVSLSLVLASCTPALLPRPSTSPARELEPATPSRALVQPAPPEALLLERVSKIRGLVPKAPVSVETLTDEAFNARYAASVPVADELRRRTLMMWVAFGFVPGGSDAYTASGRKTSFAGFYDTQTKRIVLRDRNVSTASNEALLVHELTHALQDQYFALDHFSQSEDSANEDAMLARKAVYEGDATLVAEIFGAKQANEEQAHSVATAAERARTLPEEDVVKWIGAEARLLERPSIAWKPLVFSYYTGLAFLADLQTPFDFRTIDAVYQVPPISTEQVLHPEKYRAHEPPLAIEMPDESGTLGEYRIALFLERCLSREQAQKAAAGWGNDKYIVTALPKDRVALRWLTRWDTEADAREFHKALKEVSTCYPELNADASKRGLHISTESRLQLEGDRVTYMRGF